MIVLLTSLYLYSKKKNRKVTELTRRLILSCDPIEKECERICIALRDAPIVTTEKECAEQLREILKARHLEYPSLDHSPEYLLRANRHICESDHGALGTRFTVQYNLFAGSIVALGNQEQKQRLFDTQDKGELGCFAFTEIGAGVLSGAGVETTATYDPTKQTFVIHSGTLTSHKTWISQGMYAEHAVILANLIMPENGKECNKGPHLFYTRIQNRDPVTGNLAPVNDSIKLTSLPEKTALWTLDNANIEFDHFEVTRTDLLSKFSRVDESGKYELSLPSGNKRMLDLLLTRLLTGRVCLSEYTVGVARSILRTSFEYASNRELWQGSKQKESNIPKDTMIDKSLVFNMFVDYSESLAIVAHFIASTREKVGECIRLSAFPTNVVEAVCICKFVGTSFGVDSVSVLRKIMGSRALLKESRLGPSSFVCNATCAAEGDNTIMELKIVGDIFKGGFQTMFPKELLVNSFKRHQTRGLVFRYIGFILWAMLLGKSALNDGQLLRDIAWCRANMLILDTWFSSAPKFTLNEKVEDVSRMVESYERVLMRFPIPVCH